MATTSHARAVKSLNKCSGRRRFVFKSFSRRIEEIDVDVFRSLNKIDSFPRNGSSFLKDCLIEWRELNTAEDFILLYEDLMPIVQNLPLVLINKEIILSKLLSRLNMEARLSVEPILRLIAALSRDLLSDFLVYLPKVLDSVTVLLKSGGDKEPEIVEQVFISWSYILVYLQKYLVCDISMALKMTAKLRYYKKLYVVELMAASTSYILRNAPKNQLIKGTKKLLFEVVKKPSPIRRSSVILMLYYVMKGTPSRLHSKAEILFKVLVDYATFNAVEQFENGTSVIIEVVLGVFDRLRKELSTGQSIFDNQSIHQFFDILINHVTSSTSKVAGDTSDNLDISNKIVNLMNFILDWLNCSTDKSAIASCAMTWAAILDLKHSSALRMSSIIQFLRGLLKKDYNIIISFRINILRAVTFLAESHEDEAMYILVTLAGRQEKEPVITDFFDGVSETPKIVDFIERAISSALQSINRVLGDDNPPKFDMKILALLWGAIYFYHIRVGAQSISSLLMDVVSAIDKVLLNKEECIGGVDRSAWQSLLGSVLRYVKNTESIDPEVARNFMRLAETNKLSSHVLSSVADYLDSVCSQTSENNIMDGRLLPDFVAESSFSFINSFSENLFNPSKEVRVQTLRLLCYFTLVFFGSKQKEEMKLDAGENRLANICGRDVLQLLHMIETTPYSVTTSRSIILKVSRIRMILASGSIDEIFLPIILCGLLGLFQNRFSCLWDAVADCLAFLLDKYNSSVWDMFAYYFGLCLSAVCRPQCTPLDGGKLRRSSDDLVGLFTSFIEVSSDSNPCTTILSLLLQTLQRIPNIAESNSRQIVPWFFKFLNLDDKHIDSMCRLEAGIPDVCNRAEMRSILRDWLNLFKHMRNPKGLYQSHYLKTVLQYSLLENKDEEVQIKVLESLLAWKDDFLIPYEGHLKNLIHSKGLREELTTWSLSIESGFIKEIHRINLISIILHILMPKVRSLKSLASRKHARVNHRKAVLRFIAQLPVHEIPLFFGLLVKPLVAKEAEGATFHRLFVSKQLLQNEFIDNEIFVYLTRERIDELPLRIKYGFLHVIEEVLLAFSEEHVKPFLDLLIGIVMRVLDSCYSSMKDADCMEVAPIDSCKANPNACEGTNNDEKAILMGREVKQSKDLKSLCFNIISIALEKYDEHTYNSEFWELFFRSINPFFGNLKQHGFSAEKLSAVFSCLLSMSRSPHLIERLYGDGSIISEILSILTVTTASDNVISWVLTFIDSLSNLDHEMNPSNKENGMRSTIHMHIEEIVTGLHSLYVETKRKFTKFAAASSMTVLKLLSKYIANASLSGKFLSILLRIVSFKGQDLDTRVECLQLIEEIIPLLAPRDIKKVLDAVSKLFISETLDIRVQLCKIVESLTVIDPSLHPVGKLVAELNATTILEDDNMDYETIIRSYSKIGREFFFNLKQDHALIVLSHFIHDMSSHNLGLRGYALHALSNFLDFSALILHGDEDDNNAAVNRQQGQINGLVWTKCCVSNLIKKFFLKHVADAMKAGSSVKQEWFELLRMMVIKLPMISSLHSCAVLCSDDVEQDFFYNIAHQQKHRRARSILRFNAIITANPISQEILNNVFLPLFLNIILDTLSGKNDNVRNACLEAVPLIASYMDWRSYYQLLNRCFRELNMDSNKHKILARLLCFMLDKFKFSQNNASEGVNDVSEMQLQLKDFLKKVKKLMESDDEKVSISLNLVAVKLLKLLPIEDIDMQLPSIIHHLANKLKSRSEVIRDDARSSISLCLKELGSEYLLFVVGILQSVLKRGYELHVLGYTLHFILSFLSRNFTSMKLDFCLDELLVIVKNDILGEVAEEKNVEKIAKKMKETKKLKSFESLELIARSITIKSNALRLLSSVTSQFQNSVSENLVKKFQKMLSHISTGLECNQSLDQEDLFIFVYSLIKDGVNNEDGLKRISNDTKLSSNVNHESPYGYLITEFALLLFLKYVKKVKSDVGRVKVLSMLDPFVPLLSNCLKSKYEDILVAAVRTILLLVKFPLPNLQCVADEIKVALLEIAQSSLNANSSLMQHCLKLLTEILKCTKIKLSLVHLHMIIQLPLFTDLERNPSFAALSLLRALVKRKLVVSEIYDIMKNVGELMVTSQVEPIRQKCSRIMLQFLMDYRLSESYMQQYLDFLIKNLSFEHPTGRESVLEMLHAIISKFPMSFLEKHSQTLFIHLVQRLVNDYDSRVRSMTGAVIKRLLSKVNSNTLASILDICLSWYIDGAQQLKCVGSQALGFMAEVMGKSFRKYTDAVYQVSLRILQSESSGFLVNGSSSWKEAYYTMILIEKIMQSSCETCLRCELKEIWQLISKMLLHPHVWIRSISNRLLSLYFSAANTAKVDSEMLFLLSPDNLLGIGTSLIGHIKSIEAEESGVNYLTQNLSFCICTLHSYSGMTENVSDLLRTMGKIALAMEPLQMKIVFAIYKMAIESINESDCLAYVPVLLIPLYKASQGLSGKVLPDEMKIMAQEICGGIRGKIGLDKFSDLYREVERRCKQKRDKRKQSEKAMAVVNPHRLTKRKLRLADKNRARKKRKITAFKLGRFMQ